MSLLSALGLNGNGKNGQEPSDDETEKYQGSLTFRKNTISFNGTTLLIRNVAKFEQYGLTYINKISNGLYIFSIVAAIVCLIPFYPYSKNNVCCQR
ncbi:MAG: hypothetical protein AAFN10_10025 [Bacteroidota bacterium]